jgi:hypothetical protein
MSEALDRLSPLEIEKITGIEGNHPRRQCNQLRKWGIKAEVNARREVVCMRAWIEQAGLPAGTKPPYLPSANDEADDDIGMNLGALDGKG